MERVQVNGKVLSKMSIMQKKKPFHDERTLFFHAFKNARLSAYSRHCEQTAIFFLSSFKYVVTFLDFRLQK